jgi:hypothetical protein
MTMACFSVRVQTPNHALEPTGALVAALLGGGSARAFARPGSRDQRPERRRSHRPRGFRIASGARSAMASRS